MTSEIELGEVFRLAEAAREGDIVREVGDRLAAQGVRVSGFREMQALTSRSLLVQSSPNTLLAAGRAQADTGKLTAALALYEQALPMFREAADRAGEAATRYNIAMVHREVGRLVEAIAELQLVVELEEAIQHPNLEANAATLEEVRAKVHQRESGDVTDAGRGE